MSIMLCLRPATFVGYSAMFWQMSIDIRDPRPRPKPTDISNWPYTLTIIVTFVILIMWNRSTQLWQPMQGAGLTS